MCTHKYTPTGMGTIVCQLCGLEHVYLGSNRTPGYQQSHGRMKPKTCYSRRYRFQVLLGRTCLASTLQCTDPVWDYLESAGPFTSMREIQKSLAKFPNKWKRYDCLPLFCKCYVPECDPIRIPATDLDRAMKLFDSVNSRWKRRPFRRFFSYFWLLERVLNHLGILGFLPYTKKLICKKRRHFYELMLQAIGGLIQQESTDDSLPSRHQDHDCLYKPSGCCTLNRVRRNSQIPHLAAPGVSVARGGFSQLENGYKDVVNSWLLHSRHCVKSRVPDEMIHANRVVNHFP